MKRHLAALAVLSALAAASRSPVHAQSIATPPYPGVSQYQRDVLVRRVLQAANLAAIQGVRAKGVMTSPPTVTVTTSVPAGQTNNYNIATPSPAGGVNGVFRTYGGILIAGGSTFNRCKSAVIWTSGGNLGNGDGSQGSACRTETVADAQKVTFEVKRSAGRYRFLVDGQYVDLTGTLTSASTPASTDDYITLDFGARQQHHVICESQQDEGCVAARVGATEKLTPPPAPALTAVALTDSYGTSNPTAYGDDWLWRLADRLGITSMQVAASGGTGWATTNSAYTFGQRIANGDIAFNGAPDIVFLIGSVNDRGRSDATITANALAGLQLTRLRYPKAIIVMFGCFPENTGPDASAIAVENDVLAAVTSFADPAGLTVTVPISTASPGAWITGTGYVGATNGTGNSDLYTDTDQTHMPDAGHTYIGNIVAPEAVLRALAALPLT